MARIFHRLLILSSPELVYKALTVQDGISSWWTKECIVNPQVGFINEFRFGSNGEIKAKILVLNNSTSVEWEVLEGADEWVGTHIKFELIPEEGKLFLNFEHTGWKDETDFFANCNFQWGKYLMSLKLLCEVGIGAPFGTTQ